MTFSQALRTYRPTPWQTFQRVYDKQVDGLGLAVFRIVFCAVLLAEVAHLFYFRHLVFDPIPYVEVAEISFSALLLLWMGVLVLLILGLFTRPAAWANYGFLVVIFASLQTYAYMMTPVYIGVGFLLLFLPVGRRLSLDRLRLRLRYSTAEFRYQPPATVSRLAYYVPVAVGIAFVYFDSALYKLTSPLWLAGLGMWKPLSLPYETQVDSSLVLNNEFLMKALGYLTLAFEFFFLFLFPFRRYWPVLLVIGVGLHLGILLTLPVPLFALGFGSIYVLLVPAGCWRCTFARRAGAPKLTFYAGADGPRALRTRLLIEQLDRRGAVQFGAGPAAGPHEPAHRPAPGGPPEGARSVDAQGRVHRGFEAYVRVFQAINYLRPLGWLLRLPGVYHLGRAAYQRAARWPGHTAGEAPRPAAGAPGGGGGARPGFYRAGAAAGLVGLALLQGLVSYQTPIVQRLRRSSGLEGTAAGRALARVAAATAGPARGLFGIADHPIALDEHFAGYTRLVAITYTGPDGVEQFLPVTRPSGQPGAYLSGDVWLRWTHGLVSRRIDQPRLEKGIRSFTAFWAIKHGLDLNDCRFKVKVKKIAEATDWQPDFLRRQLATEWRDAGEVAWQRYRFTAHLADIAAM